MGRMEEQLPTLRHPQFHVIGTEQTPLLGDQNSASYLEGHAFRFTSRSHLLCIRFYSVSQFRYLKYYHVYEWLQLVTTSKGYALTVLHTSQITIKHIISSQSVTVSTSRCLVEASRGWCSSFSGFPNCLRPQLPSSQNNSSQQLNCSSSLTHEITHQLFTPLTLLIKTSRRGHHRKHSYTLLFMGSCLVMAVL
jgi:hypothetical protein